MRYPPNGVPRRIVVNSGGRTDVPQSNDVIWSVNHFPLLMIGGGNCKGKRRSGSGLRFHPDRPAQCFNDLPADGQIDTGSGDSSATHACEETEYFCDDALSGCRFHCRAFVSRSQVRTVLT